MEKEIKEALPSLFTNLRATVSKPLQSVIDLETLIKYDKGVEHTTEGYRQALGIDRTFASNLKRNSVAICPSIQFKPKGRKLEDFAKETLWAMLDYDKVAAINLDKKVEKASKSKLAMVVYRTISGNGLRILLRYKRPQGCTLTATDLHRLAINKAMAYFNDLLSINADDQCRDMTRLCGLAHDENAYFNWNADPLDITPEDVTRFYNTILKPEEKKRHEMEKNIREGKATRSKNGGRSNANHTKDSLPTTEEIIEYVKNLADKWDVQFESGSHNKYLMRFTTFCHHYGAEQEELKSWLLAEYGSSYDGIPAIIKTIYKHTDSFGSWELPSQDSGNHAKRPGVRTIQQWLLSRFEFRHNTFTDRDELRAIDTRNSKYLKWTIIDKTLENSLYDKMHLDGYYVSLNMLRSVIESDFCADFNPLKNYLQNLNVTWEEGKNPDYIGQLANMIHVVPYADCYYHTQAYFVYAFLKWFVAMVAGWCTDEIVNHSVLILVGKGGIFKTTLLEKLLPPELRRYYANDSSADYTSKDFQEMGASKALINLDEFDFPKGKNLSAFKSAITKQEFTIRRPYDRYPSILKHNTSFCATSNNIHFLDEEENRRLLIWHVDHIDNPLNVKLDYPNIYAQALALAKKVFDRDKKSVTEAKGEKEEVKEENEEGKEENEEVKEENEENEEPQEDNKWVFWLTSEDRQKLEVHNLLFKKNNYIEELIMKYFRVPTEKDKESINFKFLTAADILDRISTNFVFRSEFSSRDLIPIMERLGFKRIHRASGDGWWVVEKDGKEILADHEFKPGEDEL